MNNTGYYLWTKLQEVGSQIGKNAISAGEILIDGQLRGDTWKYVQKNGQEVGKQIRIRVDGLGKVLQELRLNDSPINIDFKRIQNQFQKQDDDKVHIQCGKAIWLNQAKSQRAKLWIILLSNSGLAEQLWEETSFDSQPFHIHIDSNRATMYKIQDQEKPENQNQMQITASQVDNQQPKVDKIHTQDSGQYNPDTQNNSPQSLQQVNVKSSDSLKLVQGGPMNSVYEDYELAYDKSNQNLHFQDKNQQTETYDLSQEQKNDKAQQQKQEQQNEQDQQQTQQQQQQHKIQQQLQNCQQLNIISQQQGISQIQESTYKQSSGEQIRKVVDESMSNQKSQQSSRDEELNLRADNDKSQSTPQEKIKNELLNAPSLKAETSEPIQVRYGTAEEQQNLAQKQVQKELQHQVVNNINKQEQGQDDYVFIEEHESQIKELMKFVPYPIPDDWNSKKYVSYLEDHSNMQDIYDIIARDIHRTFPEYAEFATDKQQQALLHVLKAYAMYDKEVGYCQGMGFLAGIILFYLPEASTFELFSKLMGPNGANLRCLYLPGLEGLKVELAKLDWLMSKFYTPLYEKLAFSQIPSVLFASQWFLTVFACPLPLHVSARVIDIMLQSKGKEIMLKLSLMILAECQKDIMRMDDFEQIVKFLKFEPAKWSKDKLHNLISKAVTMDIPSSFFDQADMSAREILRETEKDTIFFEKYQKNSQDAVE